MIEVGNVKIMGDIALSPMSGISDSPYRQITRRYGSAFSYTEFVSTEQILIGNQKSIDMFRFQEMERPIFFQIFGSSLTTVVEAGKKIEVFNPDIIDLNMGCSVSKVSHSGSGAGLLRNLKLAGEMIEGLVKATKIPISAKIRLGWDMENLNFKETIHVLQESGVSVISVHGRTKSMAYSGKADWNAIGEIKAIAKVPIFGNGDVSTFAEAKEKIKQYGVDLVLIGRKAIGNPWIFSGIPKNLILFKELRKVMIEHLLSMLEFYPSDDNYGLVLFRKHFARYVEGIHFPGEIKNNLLRTDSLTQFLKILTDFDPEVKTENSEVSMLSENLDCESFLAKS